MCASLSDIIQAGDTLNVHLHSTVILISVETPAGPRRILRAGSDDKLIIGSREDQAVAMQTLRNLLNTNGLRMTAKGKTDWTEDHRMYLLQEMDS